MPSPKWIAELRVIIVHPDGRRVPGRIAIGEPYVLGGGDLAEDNHYESHCPVEITGVFAYPAIGGGTLHALLTAVDVARYMVRTFVESGGRVLDADDGTDVSLDALALG